MVRVEAYYAVDMTDFNLNRINVGPSDSEYLPDMDFDFLGQIHPEVLALQWQIGNQASTSAVRGDNFVIYRTTGQELWPLVDGAAQDEIVRETETGTFDLLA